MVLTCGKKTLQTNSPKLGRSCQTPIDILEKTLLQFKHRLIRDGKAISKRNGVWEEISGILEDDQGQQVTIKKSAAALYTYVTCNKNGVLKVLLDNHIERSLLNQDESVESLSSERSMDLTDECTPKSHAVNFEFYVQGREFDKLLITTTIKDKSKKCGTRTRKRLSKGK